MLPTHRHVLQACQLRHHGLDELLQLHFRQLAGTALVKPAQRRLQRQNACLLAQVLHEQLHRDCAIAILLELQEGGSLEVSVCEATPQLTALGCNLNGRLKGLKAEQW